MTRRWAKGRRNLRWRWLLDSPLVIAAWITVLLGAWSMQRVGGVLQSAERVRRQADLELARLVADAAVLQLPLSTPGDGTWQRHFGEIEVTIERRAEEISVVSALPGGGHHSYAGRMLAGAASPVFARARSTTLPKLDDAALCDAPRASDLPAFHRDEGVALLHFEGGTDLDDFVLEGDGGAIDALTAGVIVVPGHLWVEPGTRPLVVRCERDVTLVVLGNFYLGRSVAVEGPGRLVFATTGSEGALPFADRDGNGRRGPAEVEAQGADGGAVGAIEGGGSVYCGLAASGLPLSLQAGIVVSGYLHLARTTEVDGALAVARPVVAIQPGARLSPLGRRLFHPEREIVPGFVVAGPPRPGLLSALDAGASAQNEQALYLNDPAR